MVEQEDRVSYQSYQQATSDKLSIPLAAMMRQVAWWHAACRRYDIRLLNKGRNPEQADSPFFAGLRTVPLGPWCLARGLMRQVGSLNDYWVYHFTCPSSAVDPSQAASGSRREAAARCCWASCQWSNNMARRHHHRLPPLFETTCCYKYWAGLFFYYSRHGLLREGGDRN